MAKHNKDIDTEKKFELKKVWQFLKKLFQKVWHRVRNFEYRKFVKKLWQKIKDIKQKLKKNKTIGKILRIFGNSGKIIITVAVTFLFFYYFIGSAVVENIDIKTKYKGDTSKTPTFETARTMSFLIKREIDEKMWTPNLPLVFPAYALDNMPNFQRGMIAAIRDVSSALVEFSKNNETQAKAAEKAYKLLSYSPDVWLMSKKGVFNLAPSSNSQYRKAAKELRVFSAKGIFVPYESDLKTLLEKMKKGLLKATQKSEKRQREHSADWFDTKADDLFYYNKGYAFSLAQIAEILAADYKEILLKYDLYEPWTHLVADLTRCAEMRTHMVRNGKTDAVFSANHLLAQNYFMLKAVLTIEELLKNLAKAENANQI